MHSTRAHHHIFVIAREDTATRESHHLPELNHTDRPEICTGQICAQGHATHTCCPSSHCFGFTTRPVLVVVLGPGVMGVSSSSADRFRCMGVCKLSANLMTQHYNESTWLGRHYLERDPPLKIEHDPE